MKADALFDCPDCGIPIDMKGQPSWRLSWLSIGFYVAGGVAAIATVVAWAQLFPFEHRPDGDYPERYNPIMARAFAGLTVGCAIGFVGHCLSRVRRLQCARCGTSLRVTNREMRREWRTRQRTPRRPR